MFNILGNNFNFKIHFKMRSGAFGSDLEEKIMNKNLFFYALIALCSFNMKAMLQKRDPHPLKVTIHNNHPEAIV